MRHAKLLVPLVIALAAAAAAAVLLSVGGNASTATAAPAAGDLGQSSGLLARSKLTLKSALQVDLSAETVRVPLYKGTADGQTVWFTILDASDAGAANDLDVNYAPKLLDLSIGCAKCVQTVTLAKPSPAENPFGQALVRFKGAPDFAPDRIATPGPQGFPLAKFQPGAIARSGYSPFIRIADSPTVYNAPIVATGDGPFDVTTHKNTSDRALAVHIAPPSPDGKYLESWADMLFSKGFDAGEPIVYLSTDAGQPLTAVLERSVYVPALNDAAYNGGDDFLGSARERLFGFVNGQTGKDNDQAQGFMHLGLDGHIGEDASATNKGLIDALRNGGDLLNVFGDFPTLADPRHAQAYSPLWDAQLSLWTEKAIKDGKNTRQTDENVILNLAAQHPELITGVNPATGKPAPFGASGVDINCAVIGFTDKAPTKNLAELVPDSQSPPR
jgi:hypothetical protein